MKKLLFLLTAILMGGVSSWAEVTPQDKHVYTIKGAFTGPTYRPIYYDTTAKRFKSANGENGATPQKFVFFSSTHSNTENLATFKVGVVEGDGYIHYDPNGNDKVVKSNAADIAFPTSSTTLVSRTWEGGGVCPGYNGMIGISGTNEFRSYVVQNNTNINYNTRGSGKTQVNASNTLGATNTWQPNFLIEEVAGYDVYDVVLSNAVSGTTISYTGTSECLTTTPQSDGGYVVLATGASKTAADFNNTPATVTVNEESKTITFAFPVSVDVTYKFTNILGEEVNVVGHGYLNQNAESFIPTVPFYNATGVSEGNKTITESNKNFTVSGAWNLPFVVGNVYYLRDRLQSNGTPAYYSKSNKMTISSKETSSSFDKSYLWYFEAVSGTVDQFYLKNLLSGYVTTNANSASMFGNSGTPMRIYEFTGANHKNGADFGFVMPDGSNEVYGDHKNGGLGYWTGGTYADKMKDAGSAFQVASIDFTSLYTSAPSSSLGGFLTDGASGKYYDAEKMTAAQSAPTVANVEAVFASAQEYTITAKALDPTKYYRIANYDTSRSHNKWVGTTNEADTDGNVLASSERKVKSNVADGGVAALWQFEEGEEAYYLKNMNSGTYIFNGTTNNAHVDMPIDKTNAGAFTLTNVGGKWWSIKTKSASEWLHQSNHEDNKLLLWNTQPSLTDCQASLWSIEEVVNIPVTVSSVGYTTINFPVAVTIPAEVTAYKVTAEEGQYMTLTEVEGSVVAGTALIIEKAEGGIVNFEIATSGATIEGNLLNGTTIRRTDFAAESFYALAADETATNGVSFQLNGEGVTAIPANKAYLPVTNQTTQALYFNFNGEQTTGVESTTLLPSAEALYNLQGQPVSQPTRGIYVKANGQKVFILK